jgi:hypothetical protein
VLAQSALKPLDELGEQHHRSVFVDGCDLILPRQAVDQRACRPRELLERIARIMTRCDELAKEITAAHAVAVDEVCDESFERDGARCTRGWLRSLKLEVTVSGISLRHGPAPSEGTARRSPSPRSLRP